MKYVSTFAIIALIVGAAALIYRSADLTSETPPVTESEHKSEDHSAHKSASHAETDHSEMDHSKMGHSKMDHSKMDHSKMNHSEMDHSKMDHSKMDHSKMDEGKDDADPLKGVDFTASIAGRMKLDPITKDGVTIMNNSLDPTSGEEIGDSTVSADHQGFRIRFTNHKNAEKFSKKSLNYLARLSLEYVDANTVKLVDAASYQISYVTNCFSMGGEIDYESDVYLLHRGYKFYFCCWPGGCGQEFVDNPSAAYEHYGLKDVEGNLVASQ